MTSRALPTSAIRRWALPVILAGIAGIVAFFELRAGQSADGNSVVTVAGAVVLAALLVGGPRKALWIAVLGTAALAGGRALAGEDGGAALLRSLCDGIEVGVIFALLVRLRSSTGDFADIRGLATFTFVAVAVGPLSWGALRIAIDGVPTDRPAFLLVVQAVAANALGLIIVAPAIVAACTAARRRGAFGVGKLAGHAAIIIAGTAVTTLVFAPTIYPALFMVTPFIIIAAFRMGTAGAAISLMIVALIATLMAAEGTGPPILGSDGEVTRVFILQLFLFANFGCAMPVAAILNTQANTRRELVASKAYTQSVLARLDEVVFTMDREGRWTFLNDAWERHMGFTVAGTLGRPAAEFVVPDERAASALNIANLAIGVLSAGQLIRHVVRADGSVCQMDVTFTVQTDDDGNATGTIGTMRDVTESAAASQELERTRNELIHVSRFSAMGAMASTMAHELNQPLAAVANFARGLRTMLLSGTRVDQLLIVETLADIDEGVVRASAIVQRLRSMVEKGRVERQAASLSDLVREAAAIGLIDAAATGVHWQLDDDPAAELVDVDRIQIQQVLVNLFRNAVEAMEGGVNRRICVVTQRHGRMCHVLVSDTGPGPSTTAAAELFSPFNSSKHNGMGIGLSICRTIIENHGGAIWFDHHHEQGPTFGFSICSAANAPTFSEFDCALS